MRTILQTSKSELFDLKKYLVFDIESDGLLDKITKVHCICIVDQDGKEYRFGPKEIPKALKMLSKAEGIVGHNILGYDLIALERLYGWKPDPKLRVGIEIIDTEVHGRIHFPSIKEHDYGWARKNKDFRPHLFGRHSLEAWGYRLGYLKGTYGKTTDFSKYTPELLDYCMRDTQLTLRLFKFLLERPTSALSVEIEHLFSIVLDRLMDHGVLFDIKSAEKLTGELMVKRAAVADRLLKKIPPFHKEYITPVKKLKRVKTTIFNPASRAHIARYFQERHGWKPRVFTDGGQPKVDEVVLKRLAKSIPIANELLEHFLVDKRLSQIAEGKQAWLKKVKPDTHRIHHRINHCAANTSRCTHSGPNLAQVPRVGSPYGKECRSLFIAGTVRSRDKYRLVGTDAKGIEARGLAHYMAPYDDGAYINVILTSDIHTENQKAAGLGDRDQAKTFFYALIFGAGPRKIGKIVKGTKADGEALIDRFMGNLPALDKVVRKAKADAKKFKMLLALDGRRVHVRKAHSALNAKLQSFGAIVMKVATILAYQGLLDAGLVDGVDFSFVLHVHDEFQIETKVEHVKLVKKIAAGAVVEAGKVLGVRCPLEASVASGKSWAETH